MENLSFSKPHALLWTDFTAQTTKVALQDIDVKHINSHLNEQFNAGLHTLIGHLPFMSRREFHVSQKTISGTQEHGCLFIYLFIYLFQYIYTR